MYVPKGKVGATPEMFGYRGDDIAREKWADAIGSYLVDPNWIKTNYPDVGARIRQQVNTNPNLKDVIQFNSLAPLGVGLLDYQDFDNQ